MVIKTYVNLTIDVSQQWIFLIICVPEEVLESGIASFVGITAWNLPRPLPQLSFSMDESGRERCWTAIFLCYWTPQGSVAKDLHKKKCLSVQEVLCTSPSVTNSQSMCIEAKPPKIVTEIVTVELSMDVF